MMDFTLENARIWTGEADAPWAEAALVRDGRFVAVGRAGEINAPAGTESFDARGRLIVPGLVEGHAHLYETGAALENVNLKGARDRAEALERVAERVAATAPGAWVLGDGWDQNFWPHRAMPSRADLDAIASDRPILLRHTSIHVTWANSAALAAAGVTAATETPAGGAIDRDERGEPTGILRETAMGLVYKVVPKPTEAERERRVAASIAHAHRHGITGYHAMEVWPEEWATMNALHARGELNLRVRAYLTAERLEEWIAGGVRTGDGDAMLAVGGIKFFADGALGPLTAWMLDPFDGTGNTGLALRPPAEIEAMVERCLDHGLAPCIHAIGDRANREMLDILERTRERAPKLPRRIEHAQLVAPEDIARFGALGVTASAQPIHCTQDWEKVERSLGARGSRAYAFVDLAAAGANLAFGSDAPVETICPLVGLHAAVTRRTAAGEPEGGWYPGQRLTLEQALEAYTGGCARVTGEAGRLGRIAPGYLADFTMLDRDIFAIEDPMELLDVKVAATCVGGRVVYQSE